MPASIAIVGLAANDPVPGEYFEIDFAAGQAAAGTSSYNAILIGNKLSTGTATLDTQVYGPDTVTPLLTEADAITLFGEGSELHRMWKRWFSINKDTSVYALAVTESVGAKATATITLTTTATGGGTLRIYVGDEFVDTTISLGDNVTTIATAAAANVNSKTWWPCTASNVNGVITLQAKQKGLRGNWLRFWSRIFPACGTTTSTTNVAFFSGGTTADSNTAALAAIAGKRYYYYVSAAEDATQFGAVKSQIDTLAAPTVGIRQRAFCGSVDTLANAQTIATGINAARDEIQWLAQSDVPPCELAAHNAAVYALEELPRRPRCNFSFYGLDAVTATHWKIPAPLSGAAPTRTEIKSALNNGLTPVGVTATGATYLVKRITTRCLNGATADYRIRDAHKVTICDRWADDMQSKIANTMHGKEIGDDPVGNQPGPGANVITPRVFAASVNKMTRDYGDLDLLQRVQEIISNTIVIRETTPATRMSALVPLQTIDIFDQAAVLVQQVA